MINRERRLRQLIRAGHEFKGRPVLNEERHHGSWMFGDPVAPILRAYLGHEGMWGALCTFETRQDSVDGPRLADQTPPYTGRRVGRYPEGTRIERLLPLPGNATPPNPTPEQPGRAPGVCVGAVPPGMWGILRVE